MQIVIEIPEEQYNTVKGKLYNTFPADMRKWGLEAIRNGIPLPKKHGRLIDADKLKEVYETTEDAEYCQWSLYGVTSEIDDAETIIEADKGIVDMTPDEAIEELKKRIFCRFVTTQPKKGRGRWIRVDKDKLKCSECEVVHFIAQYPQSAKINYCPNCGCKMQEVTKMTKKEAEAVIRKVFDEAEAEKIINALSPKMGRWIRWYEQREHD